MSQTRYIVSKGYKGGDFQRIGELSQDGWPEGFSTIYTHLTYRPQINDLSWVEDDGTCYVIKRVEGEDR